MKKREIDRGVEILLEKLLDKKELEILRKIVESRGKFDIKWVK